MAYSRGKYEVKNPDKYVGLKKPTYRSSWEAAFMRFCDNHPSISKWASESVKIPYVNPLTGKNTVYWPDFFIVYTDKKGKNRAESENTFGGLPGPQKRAPRTVRVTITIL